MTISLQTPEEKFKDDEIEPEYYKTLPSELANYLPKRSSTLKRSLIFSAIWITIAAILSIKLHTIVNFFDYPALAIYSVAVALYILSRFALALFYNPKYLNIPTEQHWPTVTFGVPCKNEGLHIRETLLRIAASDYPVEKFDIIAINDGSTDNTLEEMLAAKAYAKKHFNVNIQVINWKVNKGKREGMGECVKRSHAQYIVFIDSDSYVLPDAAKEMIRLFADDDIGAVAGHAFVTNPHDNLITAMQNVRYYIAFRAYKSAEALFGRVMCCSGCCSAYRRDVLASFIDDWLEQRFLGEKCTYGDDRALTNYLLDRGYRTLFAERSITFTFVPDTLKQFMTQQLRWKKSWVRESFIACKFIWKAHPIMSFSFYLGTILPLLAPLVVFRACVLIPALEGRPPWEYIIGVALMALIYGLYYLLLTGGKDWFFGSIFAVFYTIVLIWQIPWAIVRIRDTKWGTR